MTQQWIRQFSLIVGDGAEATNMSELRGRFRVQAPEVGRPTSADITITNLSPQTANKVMKEYDRVVLQIGYPGSLATIFEGEILQKRKGRENPTDTYLNIIAAEGQKAFSYAMISKTLAAGHTFKDQVDACLEALKPYGITAGYIADLGSVAMPRGRALFGMVREQLRSICQTTGTSWHINGTKLDIVKNAEPRPGGAIVINSGTGMVGMPTQTIAGVEVRCLGNPEIKLNSTVKIDEASIQRQQISTQYNAANNAEIIKANAEAIAADGLYKVIFLEHHGDTRGTDWYTDIVCFALNGKMIASQQTSQSMVDVSGKP